MKSVTDGLMKLSFFVVLLLLGLSSYGADYARTHSQGAAATVHPLATDAAIEAYRQGGNAIDAALAAAYTLGVVDNHNSGIGGGCFVLVRYADGNIEALDGREMAPARARRDMYVLDGEVQPRLSKTGALAIGIPGSVAAYDYLSAKAGKLSPMQVILPAADLAEAGFAIDGIYAKRLQRLAESIRAYPAAAAILLDKQQQPWPKGHKLVQKDLARTYRHLAQQGAEYFYRGEFAAATEKWMGANGGLLSAQDFAAYTLKQRQPILTGYRDYQVVGFPPPSSGGVHVAQILNILEHFELHQLPQAQRYHLLAEAMQLAFADRAHWLGDPDYAAVPKGLISKDYAARLAGRITLDRHLNQVSHSTPPLAGEELFGKHTTHIATADKDGNWVAITTTLNTSFGSKVVIPGTGVLMNNQMDDFAIQPGVPNAYGLVGNEANSIAPGKRPLSSMSPTLVLKNGKPFMTLGAAGGPTIITQVVQALVNHLDLGRPLEQALATPRVHQQWKPQTLFVEAGVPQQAQAELIKVGHKLKPMPPYGSTQAIVQDRDGQFSASAEPRLRQRNR